MRSVNRNAVLHGIKELLKWVDYDLYKSYEYYPDETYDGDWDDLVDIFIRNAESYSE